MSDINAKITVSQDSNDKKEVELVMKENKTTSADAQTYKDKDDSEKNDTPTDEAGKVDFKFCWCPVVLFIVFVILFIGGIFCSVFFIKDIYEPFKNSLNFATCVKLPACVGCETCVNNSANIVACIQYTVSLALVLAAVIVASISLMKAAKWLVKVAFIKQVLSSSCNAEQKKKYCGTLADL